MTNKRINQWQLPKLSAILLLATAVLMQLNARIFLNQEYIAVICIAVIFAAVFSLYGNVNFSWLIFGVIFLIYAFLQYFLAGGISSSEGRIEMLSTLMTVVVILFLSFFSGVKPLKLPAAPLLYITSIISVLVVVSYLRNSALLMGLIEAPLNGTRAIGGFTGPNELANANVVILTYVFFYHIYCEKVKYIYAFSIPVVGAIIVTWSRGGAIEVAILFVAVCAIFVAKIPKKHRVLNLFLLAVVIAAVVYLVVVYYWPTLNEKRNIYSDRDYIISFAFEQFKDSPIIGHGYAFTDVKGFSNDTPHNEYLLYLINGGILGVLLLLVFFIKLLYDAYKKRLYPEMFAILMFYITELTFNNLIRYKTAILFWIFMAIIIVSPKRQAVRERSARDE